MRACGELYTTDVLIAHPQQLARFSSQLPSVVFMGPTKLADLRPNTLICSPCIPHIIQNT